jgi:hypothetical protein
MNQSSRSSKDFKSLGTFSSRILVKCPSCGGPALVSANPAYVIPYPMGYSEPTFKCLKCTKLLDGNKWYGPVILYPGTGICARCASDLGIKVLAAHPKPNLRANCTVCGHSQVYPALYQPIYADNHNAIDPYLGLKLYLQQVFDNNILWAYNLEHLEYLEKYIRAKLREAPFGGKQALYWKLPQFIKSAKNREKLLKIIQRMKVMEEDYH